MFALGAVLAALGSVLGGLGRSWGGLGAVLGGSWALLAGPWGTKIDFPAVLVAKIEFSKNIEKHEEKQRCLRSWPPQGRSLGLLGRSCLPLPPLPALE